ncbi:MAG: hypothetical protein KDC76_00405 [Bacteroidetes bacterium]|nr:hypothetical protein [Bacteroidota bacterium]
MKFLNLRTFLVAVLLLTFSISSAQSLKQYIPATSNVVIGINWKSLESKISFAQFNGEQVETEDNPFMSLFIRVLENPTAFGIDMDEPSYYFNELGDTVNNRVMLIGLSNRKTFMEKSLEMLKMNDPEASYQRVGNTDQYAYDNLLLSCTNDVAIMMLGKKKSVYNTIPYSSDPEFNYYQERRTISNQIDSMRYSGNDPYLTGEIELDIESDDDEAVVEEAEAEEAEEVAAEEMEIEEEAYYDSDEVMVEEAIEYEEDVEYDGDYYDEDEHPLMQALDAKRDKLREEGARNFARQHNEAIKNQLKRYTTLKPKDTYANHVRFNAVMNNEHDLSLWVNPEAVNFMFSKGLYRELVSYRNRDSIGNLGDDTKLRQLMENNFTYAYGDFNQGKLDLKLVQDRNEILQGFDYIHTEKVNQNMIKYLPQETFGYIAMNLSVEDYFESYRTFMMAVIETLPVKEQVTAGFEMMDIFLNKDIFYNTLKGDGVFAFTGLTTNISERYKYVYDEETFEREYKMVKDTSLMPEILFMATIQKEENVDRLLLAFEHMKLFTPLGNNIYQVMEDPGKKPTPFFIAKHNGMLFVSNNADLLQNKLTTGLAKADQISGNARTMIETYGNCQYWDSEKSFDAVLEVGKNQRPKEKGKIRVLQKRLASGTVYTKENGSKLETDFTLNFSDSSINSLTEFVNLLHEFEIIR